MGKSIPLNSQTVLEIAKQITDLLQDKLFTIVKGTEVHTSQRLSEYDPLDITNVKGAHSRVIIEIYTGAGHVVIITNNDPTDVEFLPDRVKITTYPKPRGEKLEICQLVLQ